MSGSESSRTPVLRGGCQCGAVRYALFSIPEGSVCHCRMCQKAVGGPFAALAKLQKTDVAWTRGQPATFHSSTGSARDFCRDCGTPLGFRFLDSDAMEVTIGSLDRPAEVPPTQNFGVESRLAWLEELMPGRLKDVTTNQSVAGTRTILSRQHPDHETPPNWRPPV